MLCNLCPRQCNALRTETAGEGYCRMPAAPVAARAALHMWEEPPISGTRGSGTIFFSGCSLGCVFCQNEKISHQDFGRPVTVERLREICLELVAQGAHNINFVNPTHYAHVVRQVLEEHLPVPVVWNSGGYDRVETLRALEGKVQIYLPDYKYHTPEYAGRFVRMLQDTGVEVVTVGARELLKLPEFRDADKAHQLMSFLSDSKENLPVPDEGPMKILIGPENVSEALQDTSVVVASYDIGDDMRGLIGVVGPTRMDYGAVAARLSGFAEGLTRLFGKQELPPKEDTDK